MELKETGPDGLDGFFVLDEGRPSSPEPLRLLFQPLGLLPLPLGVIGFALDRFFLLPGLLGDLGGLEVKYFFN